MERAIESESAVAGDQSAIAADGDATAADHNDSDSDDPMDQLDDVTETKPAAKRQAKKKRALAPGTRSAIVRVDMPMRPPCLGLQNVPTQPIWVYRKGRAQNSCRQEAKQNLWLRTDCLGWLFSYAADEYDCQGVTRATETVGAAPKANCAAVAGLRITWDFSGKSWNGMFVSGPYEGTTKTLHTEDVTSVRWTKLCNTIKPTDDSYKFVHDTFTAIRGRPSTLRTIAKDLLATWCAAVAEGNEDSFEKEWGLAMRAGRKKPRYDHDHNADSDSQPTGLGVATCDDE